MAEEVQRLEDQVGGSPGMRPGAAKCVDDLPVQSPREAFLGERSPQSVAAQTLQRLPIMSRDTLRRVQREPGQGRAERLAQRG